MHYLLLGRTVWSAQVPARSPHCVCTHQVDGGRAQLPTTHVAHTLTPTLNDDPPPPVRLSSSSSPIERRVRQGRFLLSFPYPVRIVLPGYKCVASPSHPPPHDLHRLQMDHRSTKDAWKGFIELQSSWGRQNCLSESSRYRSAALRHGKGPLHPHAR